MHRLSFRLVFCASIAFALTIATTPIARAQTFTVIHSFNGEPDGENPLAGVTIDAAGNLYGTTENGLYDIHGTVFKLTPKASGWVCTILHGFHWDDGAFPQTNVIFGPDGSLYGTTDGGGRSGNGTVFELKPPARACLTALCPWTETVIYNFNVNDGWDANDIVFDPVGNIYGTTAQGGAYGKGMVYKLTPSNGSWVESTLFAPNGLGSPASGVILDQAGNLYGTTYIGDSGTAYELTSPGWEFKVLHEFHGSDGVLPSYGLIFDSSGNLYGATLAGGANDAGTVYELTPSNGSWTLTTLYSFTGGASGGYYVGSASLTMDAAGNLYGTKPSDGAYGYGSVFKLSPSNGGWTYTSLHDFCAGGWPCSDGAMPWSTVVFDSKGNLYGTAYYGGANCRVGDGCGVVWEITP